MISELMTSIQSALSGVVTAFVNGVGAMIDLFVTKSEAGVVTGLSTAGQFVAIGIGIGLLSLVITFVLRLIKVRR